MLLCFLGDESKMQEILKLSYKLFRLSGRESLCVAIVQVALLIEDQSKLQEIFNLSYRIVWLIGA